MLALRSCRSISQEASLSGAINVHTMQMTALTTMAAYTGKQHMCLRILVRSLAGLQHLMRRLSSSVLASLGLAEACI